MPVYLIRRFIMKKIHKSHLFLLAGLALMSLTACTGSASGQDAQVNVTPAVTSTATLAPTATLEPTATATATATPTPNATVAAKETIQAISDSVYATDPF